MFDITLQIIDNTCDQFIGISEQGFLFGGNVEGNFFGGRVNELLRSEDINYIVKIGICFQGLKIWQVNIIQ